jgi:hypothetical protein
MSSGSFFDGEVAERQVPLNRVTSIPATIKRLCPAAVTGDPAVVEEVIFEPGSALRILLAPVFSLFRSLNSITVPASVEVIGMGCFAEMPLLSRVTFEAGSRLGALDSQAFCTCGACGTLIKMRIACFTNKIALFKLVDPGLQLRDFVKGLTDPPVSSESIYIPASLKTIGAEGFAHSTLARSIIFEAGSQLRTLNSRAFYQSMIQSIEIPPLVENLPQHCFEFCVMLSSVTFSAGSRLRTIQRRTFCYSGVESIQIPGRVEVIGGQCFERCDRLSSLDFEPNCILRRLEGHAVIFCTSLTSICIPASVESIGEFCFFNCEQLRSVTFESGSKLLRIWPQAFGQCKMLGPSIHLPSSLTDVAGDCLEGCQRLSVITFAPKLSFHELIVRAFRSFESKAFCVAASVDALDWFYFAECNKAIEITFESPCRVREISHFNPGRRSWFSVPDSVEILTIDRGGERGFVYDFGRNSRLRELRNRFWNGYGFGFMRLSESSVKCIRGNIESRERSQFGRRRGIYA